jgi:hypothetical protein
MLKIETINKESNNQYFVVYNNNKAIYTLGGSAEEIIKELQKSIGCKECDSKGYFEDVISEGLEQGDPYLEPHIERCDECKVFANDQEAIKYHNERNK